MSSDPFERGEASAGPRRCPHVERQSGPTGEPTPANAMRAAEVRARPGVQPLRVLAITASDTDGAAIAAQLALAGLEVALERAEGEHSLDAALSTGAWDLVLCDGQLSGFDWLQALRTLARHQIRVPLVLVSGEMHAETLAHAFREGVADYVNKDRLEQLGPVVRRCLQEAAMRARQHWLERTARDAEARMQSLMDHAPFPISLRDLDGRFEIVNRVGAELMGHPPEYLLGHTATELFDLDAAAELDRKEAAVRQRGEATTFELTAPTPDGGLHDYLVTKYPVRDSDGRLVGVGGISLDITTRKQTENSLREAEEQLRHSQKLDAVGRLAGGVAHDFNNMLTAIKGYTHLLLDSLDPGDPRRTLAEQISRAAEQASMLPRQLLAFSRKQVSEATFVDVNEVLTSASDMLGRLLEEAVELVVTVQAESAGVLADPGQIEQVLLNLAVNAGEAMPTGGRLTLTTRNADLTQAAGDELLAPAGRYVVIAVADEGEGMDAETQEKLFEPFFTTKATGSGLGLATVYGIVRQSGGFVRVDSAPGNGSKFEVWLPHSDAASASRTAPVEEHTAGTVLLAEDEQIVRDLAVTVLERAGYRVLSAANGEEALDLCLAAESEIDVLLADMVMSGMSGRELAERVLELRPHTRVVLMSGYTEEAPVIGVGRDIRPAFLQKPFAPSALLSSVETLVDRSASPADNHDSGNGYADRECAFTCLVADDHPAVLDSVSRYLTENAVDVVARVSRGDEALAQIESQRPAIALLDVRMLSRSGIEVAQQASLTAPETQIVLFTGYGDRGLLEQALNAGVRGLVLKEAPLPELLQALRTVAEGGTYVDAQLADTLASARTVNELSPLTAREQQILALVADGMTNDKVAIELGISPETVQSHVRNAMSKLQSDTRTQAVATAFRRSLLV